MRKPVFAYAKTKTQISFAVTAKLISVFVFATRIVQSLYFLNPKFQASSHLLWLYSSVCMGPGRKPRRPVFSQRGSYSINANRPGGLFHFYPLDETFFLFFIFHFQLPKCWRCLHFNKYYQQTVKILISLI